MEYKKNVGNSWFLASRTQQELVRGEHEALRSPIACDGELLNDVSCTLCNSLWECLLVTSVYVLKRYICMCCFTTTLGTLVLRIRSELD